MSPERGFKAGGVAAREGRLGWGQEAPLLVQIGFCSARRRAQKQVCEAGFSQPGFEDFAGRGTRWAGLRPCERWQGVVVGKLGLGEASPNQVLTSHTLCMNAARLFSSWGSPNHPVLLCRPDAVARQKHHIFLVVALTCKTSRSGLLAQSTLHSLWVLALR